MKDNYVYMKCHHLCKYSKILLILHPQDQTGARLLDIPDYQTVPILTYVLTG
jgi:hypothetical protein